MEHLPEPIEMEFQYVGMEFLPQSTDGRSNLPEIDVPTLVLVVPDIRLETPSPVLIGTNTLDVLYDQYFGGKTTPHQPRQYGYRAVLKTLELRQQQNRDGLVGVVRMLSKTPTIIPACCSVILEGSAKVHSPSADRWVIVEHPTQSYLPGGLCVKSCLSSLPILAAHPVKVENCWLISKVFDVMCMPTWHREG